MCQKKNEINYYIQFPAYSILYLRYLVCFEKMFGSSTGSTSAQEHSSIDIKLKRADRVYRPTEIVEGVVVVNAYKGWSHTGVVLIAEGMIHLSTASRGLSIGTETSGRPVPILRFETEMAAAGKFADGVTEIPFEFPVSTGGGSQALLESYHGVYVSIIYSIQVTCERGMMKKSLHKDLEFIIEVPTGKSTEPVPATFVITPESLENVSASILATIPRFRVSGRLHRSNCPINLPFTGEVIIEQSVAPIRSLELQLVRVETVGDGNSSREATEIQNIQIGEGNICRDMVVPMYMVFPRLFSCPTVFNTGFKIEFEVNLIVVFGDGYMITENFPITLSREI